MSEPNTTTIKGQMEDILDVLTYRDAFTVGPNASKRQKAAFKLRDQGKAQVLGEPGELLLVYRNDEFAAAVLVPAQEDNK